MKQNKQCQLLLLSLAVAACFGSVHANPVAPQVVAGQASFQQQGNVFTVTNSPNTIINWQSFSVNANEVTRFLQQGADSKVLNRITGQDPSRILGALQSNGQVYLINPNGILFGKDARIDVQGLAASSLGLSNEDFLAGRQRFNAQGAAGKVENQGSIQTGRGGQVYLVAPNVENSGIINTPGGAVMLAAGHSVQLVDAANPALQVVVSAPADSALNLGQLVAQGGRIGMFGALVTQRGVANADSAVLGENGKVLLRSSSRTMLEGGSRTSARGGEVAILGPQVGLTGNARVDAGAMPGAAGDGGSVLVGGDVRGANAAVPNAQQVYVGQDAVLAADAGSSGKGGKVVVWADDIARVHGTISARGGAAGGDGGFVETSAQQLETAGLRVDAGAAQGKRGQWLLDPLDIVVKAVPNVPAVLDDVATFGAGAADGVTEVAAALLSAALADITLQGKHDITFSDALAIAAPAIGLTAQAGNDININAALSTNGGSVTLIANDSASGAATGSGSVNVASSITTGVGSIELKGAGVTLSGAAALSGQEMRLLADKIDFAGGASVAATNSVYLAPRSSGNAITLGGSGPGANGTLNLSGTTLAAISAQSVNIGSAGSGSLSVTGALDLSGSNAGTSMLTLIGSTIDIGAALKPKSGVYLQSPGAIGGSGAISAPSLFVSGGSIALNGANQVNLLAAAADGDISFRNASALMLSSTDGLAGVQTSGNVTLEAPNIGQDFDAPLAANTLTLKSSGMIGLGTSYDNHATRLVADNVGGLQYTDSGSVNIASMSLANGAEAGGLLVDAGSSLAVSGTVDARGGMLQLIGGNVALGSAALVKGKDVRLTARSEGLSTDGASQIAGNYVTLHANNMALAGTVQGISSAALPESGVVTLTNPGGVIQLGGDQSNLSYLSLDSGELSKISARTLAIDNMGVEVGGRAIKMEGLDLSGMALSEALLLRSSGSIDLAGSITLPASATLIANAAGTIGSNAQLQAHAVKLDGQALNITGGAIVANGGAGGVALYSAGSVELGGSNPSAGMPTFLSSSVLDGISASGLQIGSGGAMTVSGQVGSAARNLDLEARGGTLTIAGPVSADNVKLEADAMDISGTVTANLAVLAPVTAGNTVSIGAACGAGCLSLTQLDKIAAPTVGIGNSDADGVGALTVAGAPNLNAATTRLGLLSKGSITQAVGLSVQELGIEAGGNVVLNNAANAVDKLAATITNGDFTFRNSQSLAIARLQGGSAAVESDYDINGVNGTGTATFDITGSLTTNGAAIAADKLVATASGSIGTASVPLLTHVNQLHAESTLAIGNQPIRIVNNQKMPGLLNVLLLKTNAGNAGSITLDNYGETVVPLAGEVVSDSGNIAITAHSPLRIEGRVESVSGDISLAAGSSGNASDDLVIGANALVRTASGNIAMSAGSDIVFPAANVQAPNGRIAQAANLNQPPFVPPTVDQCVANPALAGCAAVLPPLAQCVANPALAGCAAVLPPLDQCVANPAAPGCQVVLPSLNQCVATPTLAGCSAVLPPLNQCVATPALPGCQVVLPPIDQCVSTPSAPGCQVVLPSFNQCVATPALPGCSVVLPALNQCVATPTLPGCQVVLPALDQCVATPKAPGCQVVLPPLNQCVASPNLPGCSAVLPSISQCVAVPTAAGCQVVLPALAQCVANPAAPGCQVVLPSLTQCVAAPSQTGCAVVLPTIAHCTLNPTDQGCQVVLPTLGQCVSNPAAPGCKAVLPTLAQCVSAPTQTGCAAVLPSADQCAANPTAAGCAAVLPRPSDICTIAPNSALCQVLQPPTASQPEKPVQQVADNVIKEINQATAQVNGSAQGKADEKKQEKKAEGEKALAPAEKFEVKKDEPVKKLYCN